MIDIFGNSCMFVYFYPIFKVLFKCDIWFIHSIQALMTDKKKNGSVQLYSQTLRLYWMLIKMDCEQKAIGNHWTWSLSCPGKKQNKSYMVLWIYDRKYFGYLIVQHDSLILNR